MDFSNAYSGQAPLANSVRKTLFNTFATVGGMWLIAAFAAYLTLDWKLGLWGMLGLFAAAIACIFAVHAFRNSGVGVLLLAVFAGLEGATLGPLLNHYLSMQGGSQLVMTAAGLTTAATASCALFVVLSRRSFSRWGGFLFAGLIVLLVASLIGMFFPTPAVQLVISSVAALLFLGYMLYDIGEVVNGNQDNYVVAALSIFLDMFNFFVHVLRLLGILGSSDD